jgi:NAD(P)-dependent dehydrogenase (short-subunit alcohol dehydrogenase family)
MAQSTNRGTHDGDASKSKHADAVRETVQRQRRIQAEADQRDEQKKSQRSQQKQSGGKQQEKPPVQAGLEKEPVNPMPAQHLRKPGNEHELREAPRFLANRYRGSGKLEGMAALITGGDSGIGRSVAVLFAREGADVAIVYLSEHQDAQDTKRYVEKEGRRCLMISGDVRDSRFCEEAVAQTVEAFGRLDVLVNNAAYQQHSEKLEEITDEQLQETLQTNIGGYLHMARAALPHMKEGASIINNGSETGIFGSKQLVDYAATKGAVHAFTKALASNLLERGIRVNCVAPGPVWTPFNPADAPAEKVAQFGKSSDMGRPAQPEEISPAFVFLASPVCSSYVNGVVLPVMGGPRG